MPCGTTGESPTLSHEEHKKIIEETIRITDKRIPVIAIFSILRCLKDSLKKFRGGAGEPNSYMS